MKAMILAAGLGSRLKEHTADKPKALVEVNGKPLLGHIINRLKKYGFNDIIINIHHFSQMIVDFIHQGSFSDIKISFSEEPILLDTGGGLLNARWFFDDNNPFILHNVDIITDLDLKELFDFHISQGNLATVAIRKRQTKRYILFNETRQLIGWESLITGEKKIVQPVKSEPDKFSFMGIHVFSPAIFSKIQQHGVFSIIDTYLDLAQSGEKIGGFSGDKFEWLDIGKPDTIKLADEFAKRLETSS